MDFPGIKFRSLITWFVIAGVCAGEKLSPNQKAPPFARGSGGLILKAPFEGEQGKIASSSNTVDGVEREETETYKLVDGQLVRTVKGHFSYKSPEGLAIFVKYVADENGNRASFKFGTGTGVSAGQPGPGKGNRGEGKGSTYLPPSPPPNSDRTYLPPN